jgi:hypothetical protein
MHSRIFRLAAALLLAWAAIGTAEAKPDEVSEAAVQHCRFLSRVDGSSGYGKNHDWRAMAKGNAERKAGNLGATHIVFTRLYAVGAFNGEASAKAYACR